MATRTKDSRVNVTNILRNRCSGPPLSTYQQLAGPVETWTAVFSRQKPKILKVTSMTYKESVSRENRTSGCRVHNGGTPYREGTQTFCHNATSGKEVKFDSRDSVSTATTLAKAKFVSSSYAETLAESRRTSRMIGNRIGTLASLANAIRARDRIRADKIAARIRGEKYSHKDTQGRPISRRFADGWLEYQFGWLPLLSDIYDAVDYYNRRLHRGVLVSRSHTTNGGFSHSRDGTVLQRAERLRKHGAAAKAVVRTRVTNPTLRTLSEMGLLNPASLAWDLLPYSFVVDWLMPVSSLLKSLLYDAGLQEFDSYSVTERGQFYRGNPACCGPFVFSYQRTVVRQPLVPGVLPELLTNPRDMGLWHIITSTALLRQQFKGGRI